MYSKARRSAAFLRNHKDDIATMDLFTVPTLVAFCRYGRAERRFLSAHTGFFAPNPQRRSSACGSNTARTLRTNRHHDVANNCVHMHFLYNRHR